MKFFSRETCERLQAAGCVSTSPWNPTYKQSPTNGKNYIGFGKRNAICIAFGWWDFCGPCKMARENAKIIAKIAVGGISVIPKLLLQVIEERSNIIRHAIIDLTEDEMEGYIISSMEG